VLRGLGCGVGVCRVRVLNLCLCFPVQAINVILSLGNVDCIVAVILRGSIIQQCHSTNWT